jgi:hypothetical protein
MALEIIEQSCCMLQTNKCLICLQPDATDAEPLVFSALESIHAALAIMTHHDMPKQLYQEEEYTSEFLSLLCRSGGWGGVTPRSNPLRLMGHRQCGYGPLIFSASSSGRIGGSGGNHACSHMLNALPARNILPSFVIL